MEHLFRFCVHLHLKSPCTAVKCLLVPCPFFVDFIRSPINKQTLANLERSNSTASYKNTLPDATYCSFVGGQQVQTLSRSSVCIKASSWRLFKIVFPTGSRFFPSIYNQRVSFSADSWMCTSRWRVHRDTTIRAVALLVNPNVAAYRCGKENSWTCQLFTGPHACPIGIIQESI